MPLIVPQSVINDLRLDLADRGDPPAFTDPELHRLVERAGGRQPLAKRLAIGILLMDAAKLHNYALGQNSESVSQVFEHLERVYALLGRAGVPGVSSVGVGTLNTLRTPPDLYDALPRA